MDSIIPVIILRLQNKSGVKDEDGRPLVRLSAVMQNLDGHDASHGLTMDDLFAYISRSKLYKIDDPDEENGYDPFVSVMKAQDIIRDVKHNTTDAREMRTSHNDLYMDDKEVERMSERQSMEMTTLKLSEMENSTTLFKKSARGGRTSRPTSATKRHSARSSTGSYRTVLDTSHGSNPLYKRPLSAYSNTSNLSARSARPSSGRSRKKKRSSLSKKVPSTMFHDPEEMYIMIQQLKTENSTLKKDMKKMKTKLQASSTRGAKKARQLEELLRGPSTMPDGLQREVNLAHKMKDTIQQLELQLEQRTYEVEALRGDTRMVHLREMENELMLYQNESQRLQQEYGKCQFDLEKAKEQNGKFRELVVKMKHMQEHLKKKRDLAVEENKELKETLDDMKVEHDDRTAQAVDTLQMRTEEVQSLKEQQNELESEISRLHEAYAEKIEQLLESFQEERNIWIENQHSLRQEVEEAHEATRRASEAFSQHYSGEDDHSEQGEYEDTLSQQDQPQQDQTDGSYEELKEAHQSLQEAYANQLDITQSLEKEVKHLQAKNESLLLTVKTLEEDEVATLKRDLAMKKEAMDDMEGEFEQKYAEIEKILEMHEAEQVQLEKQKKELVDKESEIQKLAMAAQVKHTIVVTRVVCQHAQPVYLHVNGLTSKAIEKDRCFQTFFCREEAVQFEISDEDGRSVARCKIHQIKDTEADRLHRVAISNQAEEFIEYMTCQNKQLDDLLAHEYDQKMDHIQTRESNLAEQEEEFQQRYADLEKILVAFEKEKAEFEEQKGSTEEDTPTEEKTQEAAPEAEIEKTPLPENIGQKEQDEEKAQENEEQEKEDQKVEDTQSDMTQETSGTLSVSVVKALNVKGDLLSKADPYVKIILNKKQKFKTKTIKKNSNPEFHETFEFNIVDCLTEKLTVQLYDDDLLKDDKLGEWLIDLNELSKNVKVTQVHTLPKSKSKTELTLTLCPTFGKCVETPSHDETEKQDETTSNQEEKPLEPSMEEALPEDDLPSAPMPQNEVGEDENGDHEQEGKEEENQDEEDQQKEEEEGETHGEVADEETKDEQQPQDEEQTPVEEEQDQQDGEQEAIVEQTPKENEQEEQKTPKKDDQDGQDDTKEDEKKEEIVAYNMSKLELAIISAKGIKGDILSKPDVFVTMNYNKKTQKTTTKHDKEPIWNELFIFDIVDSIPILEMKVMEDDMFRDDTLATYKLDVHAIQQAFESNERLAYEKEHPIGKHGSIKIKYGFLKK